jgi:hypothetical protein
LHLLPKVSNPGLFSEFRVFQSLELNSVQSLAGKPYRENIAPQTNDLLHFGQLILSFFAVGGHSQEVLPRPSHVFAKLQLRGVASGQNKTSAGLGAQLYPHYRPSQLQTVKPFANLFSCSPQKQPGLSGIGPRK